MPCPYIIDAPGGGGKIPVAQLPAQHVGPQGHPAQLRGLYHHLRRAGGLPAEHGAKYKGEKRPSPDRAGVFGLLDGEEMFIKPEGFDELHDRAASSTA
jgi:lysine 2,3-aminomutase